MHFRENIILAINGLKANKMRALLTMLGIIIGISSVITIVTIGNAVTGTVTNLMNDMGANSIQIRVADKPDEHGNYDYARGFEDEDLISLDMVKQYQEAFSDKIHAVAISRSVGSGQAMVGRKTANGDIQGTNAGAIAIQNVDIIAGHFLNEREVDGAKPVAVISDKFVEKLFGIPPQQALGKEFKIRVSQGMLTFTVVGVYRYEVSAFAANMTGDVSTSIFIPLTTANRILGTEDQNYWGLQIKANDSVTNTQQFAAQTQDFFNKRFYRSNPYYEVNAQSLDSMIGQFTAVMGTLSLAIGIIAGISLLVGGIGVMNIMLVSVTERTREIGTRKALGAKNIDIRVQFIVESIIICLIGGIIGIIFGTSLGLIGAHFIGVSATPGLGVIFIAVSFSMAIGVFFGYYPANKAAKLDPIEALRYE